MRPILRPHPPEQPSRQDAIRRDADAKRPRGREDGRLEIAGDQRVFDLQIADRVRLVRPSQGVGADLG